MGSDDVTFINTCNILDDNVDVITKFPATSDQYISATIAGTCAMLTCTAIYLNACTVITIWKTPILSDKISNFTIMMQSTIDFLRGLFVMPLFTYLMLSEVTGRGSCLVAYVCKKLASLIFLFSVTTFSALNYERYTSICHPIFHRTKIKKRHLLNYVVAVCTLQSLTLSSTFYYSRVMRSVLGVFCLTFLAHTVFSYAKIARAIQIKVRVNENRRVGSERRKLMQYLSEIKAAKTCFLLVICCILCNLPAIVTFSFLVEVKSSFETLLLRKCFTVLVILNSSLNSLILFWRNKKLRVYMKTPLRYILR